MRPPPSKPSNFTGASALKRRDFVKTFILYAATSSISGTLWRGLFMAEAHAADIPVPFGQFSFRVSSFPALSSNLGSVSMEVPGIPNILVTRLAANSFVAVTSTCTHMGCSVSPYNPTFGGMHCPCHFSLFHPDGSVIQGPAPAPLYQYKLAYDGTDSITLDLVKFSYLISGTVVTLKTSGKKRFSLNFQTELSNNYSILFKASPNDTAWSQLPFSTTLEGGAAESSFLGTGTPITLFVDINQPTGIYAVVRHHLLGG